MPRSAKVLVSLLVLCALELLLFSRSSAEFFDGDAFFHFPNRITHSGDLVRYFTSLDVSKTFRPLTHVFFSFVLYPLMGLHARPYSFVSVGFHILNTVLVFFLLRNLTRSHLAVIAGAIFWGLNPVAIYVTHGICFMPDYFFAFFYLLATLAFLRYRKTRRLPYGLLTLLLFILALFTKEMAVTLPISLAMLTFVAFAGHRAQASAPPDTGKWVILSLFLILFSYLLAYHNIKGGSFYDQGPSDNYRLVASYTALSSKVGAFKAGLYFPFQHYRPYHVRLSLLLSAALLVSLIAFAAFTLRSLLRGDRLVLAGLLWMFIALMPVLFIVPTEFIHNLYIPLVGMALVVGLFVQSVSAYIAARIPRAPAEYVWAYLFFVVLLSLLVNQDIFKARDWRPYYEKVAQNCIRDLQRMHPTLAPGTILYFLRSTDRLQWLLYNGRLINVFYNDNSLRTRFGERDAVPEDALQRGQALVLGYSNDHLYDVTQDYLAESSRGGFDLLSELPEATVSFNRNEFYPNYEKFDTPEGKPVFLAPVARGGQFRMAMITIAGARVNFKTPTLTRQSKLEVAAAMKYEQGDGAQGRIYFEHGGARDLIYDRYLNPQDRRWVKDVIDLGRYAGQSGRLLFECNSGPKGDTVGDWFGWSGLRITHTRGNTVGVTPQALDGVPRLELSRLVDSAIVQFQNRRFPFSRATCTPSTSPVFFHSFTREGVLREAVITLAGSTLTFYLNDLRPNLTLHVMAAMPFDRSAVGRILLVDGAQRHVVFQKALNPAANASDRRWFEETIPLHNPATPEVRLILECLPGDSNNLDAAWFGWHLVELY